MVMDLLVDCQAGEKERLSAEDDRLAELLGEESCHVGVGEGFGAGDDEAPVPRAVCAEERCSDGADITDVDEGNGAIAAGEGEAAGAAYKGCDLLHQRLHEGAWS